MTDLCPHDFPARPRRRTFLRLAFGGLLAATGAGALRLVWDFVGIHREVWGRNVTAGRLAEFPRGGPPMPREAPDSEGELHRYFVVNLDPADTDENGSGQGDGVLAYAARCTHRGCALSWNPTFDYEGLKGWFRCPCHGSTFSKAGVRVYGPSPRSLDTLSVHISSDGRVIVDTGSFTAGGDDNPKRARKV